MNETIAGVVIGVILVGGLAGVGVVWWRTGKFPWWLFGALWVVVAAVFGGAFARRRPKPKARESDPVLGEALRQEAEREARIIAHHEERRENADAVVKQTDADERSKALAKMVAARNRRR